MKIGVFLFIAVSISGFKYQPWGFFGHRQINKLAIFTLPPEMMRFYKKHIDFIMDNSVNPDKRRYAIAEEAARHYIDMDVYPDSAFIDFPGWQTAVTRFGEDSLLTYGIVPWHIMKMKNRLIRAFIEKDIHAILSNSTEIAHYIGDANVPLHTTENYNGQLTGQYGIHGFWESRLVELFFDQFDFFVGRATYVENVQKRIWENVLFANSQKDSVLFLEKSLTDQFPEDKKFSFETRGTQTVKVYSLEFSKRYHFVLKGMVETQMRRSVKMVGDMWYTAWIEAGQPDLDALISLNLNDRYLDSLETTKSKWLQKVVKGRNHEQ